MTKARVVRKKKAKEEAGAETCKDSNSIQKFDGQLPPILPKLQWPDELYSHLGSGARRRIELTNRAYSAAVYAHQHHFAQRNESLLSEPTRKLFRSEKEHILRLFAGECIDVLNSVRELGGMARPIPPTDRMALLNDYQAWMKQLKKLLREALFADDPESRNQALIDLFQQYKPGDPFPKTDFLYLVKKPVFCEHRYFLKFTDLFLAQWELEQRFCLMIDITLDLINAYKARMRKKSEVKTESKVQVWSDNAPDYKECSILVKFAEFMNRKLSDSKLSKALKPTGQVRYMRKRKPFRCKAHIGDFMEYIRMLPLLKPDGDTVLCDEAFVDYVTDVEAKKAEIKEQKRRRGKSKR